MKKRNIGSSFDNWLREEGIFEEVGANTTERVLVRQVNATKNTKRLFKTKLAGKGTAK